MLCTYPAGGGCLCVQSLTFRRTVSSAGDNGMQQWLDLRQQPHLHLLPRICLVMADIRQQPLPAGTIVPLLPRTAALAQVGGLNHITLRGHVAPIRAIAISPNGKEVLMASADGSAQVRSPICVCWEVVRAVVTALQ